MAEQGVSVLEDCGVQASPCGYCNAPGSTSVSYGMWAHRLTVEDYQGARAGAIRF